jgi:hypothetical protein
VIQQGAVQVVEPGGGVTTVVPPLGAVCDGGTTTVVFFGGRLLLYEKHPAIKIGKTSARNQLRCM